MEDAYSTVVSADGRVDAFIGAHSIPETSIVFALDGLVDADEQVAASVFKAAVEGDGHLVV